MVTVAQTTVPTPAAPDAPPPYASWPERVIATLLDGALLFAVSFLVLPVQPVRLPDIVPGPWGSTDGAAATQWTDSTLLVALVVAAILAQAFLGSTPGKLAAGIAVVRERDGRPAGLPRTLLRTLAHLLDGILLIGYLRPLWHARHQTFADSIAGTVVLSTRRPLAFTARAPAGPTRTWERAATPAWRTAARVVALIACAAAAAMTVWSSASSPSTRSESCTVLPAPTSGTFTFSGGSVSVDPGTFVETRLGIEREKRGGDSGIDVSWEWSAGQPPGGEVGLRAVFTRADGSDPVVVDEQLRDGVLVVQGPGTPDSSVVTGVRLPIDTVSGLGDDWAWTLSATTDGETSPACTSP